MKKHRKKIKPVVISVVSAAVIVLATLLFVNKNKNNDNNQQDDSIKNEEIKAVSSGIDASKRIENVADVEEVIAKWVENNPKFIVESVMKMQKKAMEENIKKSQEKLSEKKSEIFKDKNSPTYSPSGANVTIVEFFDYSCGYCKKAHEIVEKLISEDKKVKIIYKEYPILGQASEDISKVSLAVNIVDSKSYKKFHDKIMSGKVSSKEEAINIAKEVGINEDKLKKTLEKDAEKIQKIIDENRKLASDLGIGGTPAFIIGDELAPGMLDLEALKEKVKKSRK
jgi:protein-disulfide isomerase